MRRLFLFLLLTIVLGALEWSPARATNAMGPGLYDDRVDTQGLIVFSGSQAWVENTWTSPPTNCAYQGTTTASRGTNGVIEFSIWGGGFVIYGFEHNLSISTDICVDGTCQNVSWYATSTNCKSVSVTGLSYGTHDIEIDYVGSGATNYYFYFDAVQVLPPPAQPTLPPATLIVSVDLSEATPAAWVQTLDITDSEENTQTVAFSYSMNAGEALNGLIGIATLFLIFIGLMFWLWESKDSDE